MKYCLEKFIISSDKVLLQVATLLQIATEQDSRHLLNASYGTVSLSANCQ